MSLSSILGGSLAASLLLLILTAGYARHIQNEYDRFVLEQEVLAKAQLAENARLKKELEDQKETLEADHAKNLANIRARYDAELLRAQRPRAGGVPQTRPTSEVCNTQADNDRLSNALSRYREGVLRLLEEAERQTLTLTTCQAWISR